MEIEPEDFRHTLFYGFPYGHVGGICTFPIGIRSKVDASNMSVALLEKAVFD